MRLRIRRTPTRFLTGALVVGAALVSLGQAATVRTLNLVEMERHADRIFWGKCVSVVQRGQASPGLPIQQFTFRVRQAIKGVREGQKITFLQIGRARPAQAGIFELPSYREGQEVLLFLHADSSKGLTSPVGLQQGVFAVGKQEGGGATVVNALKNRNLAFGLSDQTAATGLNRADLNRLQRGHLLSLAELVRMLDKIRSHRFSSGRATQ